MNSKLNEDKCDDQATSKSGVSSNDDKVFIPTCYICNVKGHKAPECPDKPKKVKKTRVVPIINNPITQGLEEFLLVKLSPRSQSGLSRES